MLSQMSKSQNLKPLPLSDTLRDLALLRASELDLSSLLPSTSYGSTPVAKNTSRVSAVDIDASVERSYDFARESRMALKIHNRGDAETQGERVEDVRSKLDDVLKGLSQDQQL